MKKSVKLSFVALLAVLSACAKVSSGGGALTVTASGQHVTVSPDGSVRVQKGATQAFTVTPDAHYHTQSAVTGSCPAGSWEGNTYTTGAITGDCEVSFAAALNTYQVAATGTDVIIEPSVPQTVVEGETQSFTVTTTADYTVSSTVGGTCPAGAWAGHVYTTGPITSACNVSFSATLNTYQVMASGTNVSIEPSTSQTVAAGSTQSFTVIADAYHTLSQVVGGSCPAGSWSGSTYTTGAITSDCDVSFVATLNRYQVTASGANVTFDPSGAQTVDGGTTQAFTVTADEHYTVSTTVGGTCPAGAWTGSTYTTGPIASDCTVQFSATLVTYRVTASGDAQTTLLPSAPQAVGYGLTQAFTVTTGDGWVPSTTVGGDCPAGSWSGYVYTTGAITADCSVTFTSTPGFKVSVTSTLSGSVSPSGLFGVAPGSTQAITVTPAASEALSPVVGGTCPAGTWSGNVYTTGAISADCSVRLSSVVPVLQQATWLDSTTPPLGMYSSFVTVTKPTGPTDTIQFSYSGDSKINIAQATATADEIALLDWSLSSNHQDNMVILAFSDGPEGRTFAEVLRKAPLENFSLSGRPSLSLRAGYTFGFMIFDRAFNVSDPEENWTIQMSTVQTAPDYHVTVVGGTVATVSSTGATVPFGATPGVTVTATGGGTLSSQVGGDCPPGAWSGSTYTTGPITADCTVTFDGTNPADGGMADGGTTDGGGGDAGVPDTGPSDGGSPGAPNQAPTIALGADPYLGTGSSFSTSLGWAVLSPGPATEAAQHLTASLAMTGTTGTLAFDTPPTLDVATGSLSFAARPGTYGTATVLLTLQDDGGTANGGVDTTTATFTVTVNSLAMARDVSAKNYSGSPCIPVTLTGLDVHYNDQLTFNIVSLPRFGFVTQFVGSGPTPPSAGYSVGTDGAGTYNTALCYVPFVSTFVGLDSFVYSVQDDHGGPPSLGAANVEIVASHP